MYEILFEKVQNLQMFQTRKNVCYAICV